MDIKNNKIEIPKQQMVEEVGSDSATAQQNALEKGAEIYAQAEEAVGTAYEKTAQVVNKTYEKAKSYSSENPGKTMLLALGIGVGLGFILGASSRRSGAGRFARPVVNALSGIALEFLR